MLPLIVLQLNTPLSKRVKRAIWHKRAAIRAAVFCNSRCLAKQIVCHAFLHVERI
jgi:hypothetical protein